MNSRNDITERGQVIVYLVLGFVVFLGFVALAIDGGMVLADRRHAQNSADAASLAGGAAAALHLENLSNATCNHAWSCDDPIVLDAIYLGEEKADARARSNMTFDNGLNELGVSSNCSYRTIDVTVTITAETPSNFLQLFSTDALVNEVDAVTRVKAGGPVGFGNAIVALDPDLCTDPGSQGVIIGGSGTVYVTGGDIFSNGCMRQNGDAMTVTLGINADAWAHQTFKIDPDNWDPATPEITSTLISPADYEIEMPDCSTAPIGQQNVPAHSVGSSLADGLWCITGDLIINQSQEFSGDGVTIVMLDGKFIINGPADINLYAPDDDHTDTTETAVPGIVIYLPNTNPDPVTLNGGQTSEISGLIYAPSSLVTLTGTGGNTYNPSQVLGWDVEITGDADLRLTYDGCAGYIRHPKIELYK